MSQNATPSEDTDTGQGYQPSVVALIGPVVQMLILSPMYHVVTLLALVERRLSQRCSYRLGLTLTMEVYILKFLFSQMHCMSSAILSAVQTPD